MGAARGRPVPFRGSGRGLGRQLLAVGIAASLAGVWFGATPAAGSSAADEVSWHAGPAVAPLTAERGTDRPRAEPVTAQAIPDAPGITRRVSLSSAEGQGNGASGGPPPPTIRAGTVMSHGGQAISADARWVAFVSAADDLVPGDTNGTTDVFLRDRVRGTTIRIPSLRGTELSSRYAAAEPSISADGSVVAFTVYQKTSPTNAIGVFVYDASTGQTEIGSIDDNELLQATQPSISPDGRYLAYVGGDFFHDVFHTQVYVHDRLQGFRTMVSLIRKLPAFGFSRAPSISRDGRYVAFESDALFLASDSGGSFAPRVRSPVTDIFRIDLATGAIIRLSQGPGAAQGNGDSTEPSISDDGSVVVFASLATNLTNDGGQSGYNQIYVWRATTSVVELVSVDQSGTHAADASYSASVSADGNFVAFQSAPPDPTVGSTRITPGVLRTSGPGNVFLRDLRRSLTTRISVDSQGRDVSGDSGHPSVSGDGMATAFDSDSTSLVTGDSNEVRDVFVRDLVPAARVTPAALDFGTVFLGGLGGPLSVTVTSVGWPALQVQLVDRGGANLGDFRVAVNGCAGLVLPQDASCRIQMTFRPTAVGDRTATLQIFDTSQTSPHSVDLRGAGGEVTLTLSPTLGPPGIVTVATGTGFPPGGQVAFLWDRGISANMDPVTVDAAGRFSVGILVFHHDQIGERNLVATDVSGGAFPTTKVPFLVVVPTAQPPALGPFRYLPADAKPIVDRR